MHTLETTRETTRTMAGKRAEKREGALLVINAGSSSLKFSVLTLRRQATVDQRILAEVISGQVSGIGTHAEFSARTRGDASCGKEWPGEQPSRDDLLEFVLRWIEPRLGGAPLIGAAHRVVHGGTKFSGPAVVDGDVLADLEALVPLAPLHQPHNLAAIRALGRSHPGLMQVACFDTAFHTTVAPVEYSFALPADIAARGIRRYGFHGLSYEYVAGELRRLVPGTADCRTVVCHLGSGASLCALRHGRSQATTMGFTALDGLPMGTRCGALDAGVVLHLLDAGMGAADIQKALYSRSGLLGLSGISNDVRDLLASDKPEAAFALDVFVHRIAREIGALSAVIGGLDALVFTAGIGERSAVIRRRVCDRLKWLGVALDGDANERGEFRINAAASHVGVYRIATNEELMIARHAEALIG
jgi:acetate kinase